MKKNTIAAPRPRPTRPRDDDGFGGCFMPSQEDRSIPGGDGAARRSTDLEADFAKIRKQA